MNLPHGIVAPANGAGRVMIQQKILANGDQHVELIQGPPAGFGGAHNSWTGRPASPPIGIAVEPSRRGIIFAPKARRWVNNPDAPAPMDDRIEATNAVNAPMRMQRGFSSGSTSVKPPAAPPAPSPIPARSMRLEATPPMPPPRLAGSAPPPVPMRTRPFPSRWESTPAMTTPAPQMSRPPANAPSAPATPRQTSPAPPASRGMSVPRNPAPRPQQQ